jgi:hypothetical protein
MTTPARLRLQPRDRSLLVALYHHGFLLRDHIWHLFFPDCQLRRVTRRLTALKENGLVVADVLPLGALPLGMGTLLSHPGQYAYRLGEMGVTLVAETLELDRTAVRRRLRASPSYTGHAVAVAALRVALSTFQTRNTYGLVSFATEGEARFRYRYRKTGASEWTSSEVRPDALALLERQEQRHTLFLEADLSTQGKSAFGEKLIGYAMGLQSGALAKTVSGSTLRLGVVTTSSARLEALAALVRDSPLSATAIVGLTTFERFLQDGPLNPIWAMPSVSTERRNTHVLLDL